MKTAAQVAQPHLSLAEAILGSITTPMLAVDAGNRFLTVNPAAEEFFQVSMQVLADQTMDDFFDPPVIGLLERARQNGSSVNDQGVEIRSPKLGRKLINIQISPLMDHPVALVIAIQERSLAEKLRGQEMFRGAARSMGYIAALLSHEIKNPLAGIRGAAELIATDPGGDNQSLTDLITAEADRIAALLTRAETLAGGQPPRRQPVNINEILHHAISLADSSFGKGRDIIHQFDPSLPMASGDRDLLIQCFINLIKNACEATDKNGLITVKTSYNLGARFALGGDQDGARWRHHHCWLRSAITARAFPHICVTMSLILLSRARKQVPALALPWWPALLPVMTARSILRAVPGIRCSGLACRWRRMPHEQSIDPAR